MKRKSNLLEERSDFIYSRVQRLEQEGYKKSEIWRILSDRLFLAESTIERIYYDKNYLKVDKLD